MESRAIVRASAGETSKFLVRRLLFLPGTARDIEHLSELPVNLLRSGFDGELRWNVYEKA